MVKTKNSKHQRIVDDLVERLKESGFHCFVQKNVEYERDGIQGELDVMTMSAFDLTLKYYEVKSVHTMGALIKACKQVNRFRRAYPEYNIKGIYVTPQRVRRI